MAFVVKDRVKETSTTQGTVTFVLDGAATGFQSFSAIGDGNTTYYTIVGGSQWEVGIGIYTASGTTLSRDTVLSSSNNGNLVNFSAGSKDVFVVYPAGRAVVVNGTTIEVPNLAVLPVSAGGTGSNTATFSGANISSLNASNVSSGVLAVAQGGTGSTTASFSGANITSLNASNVTSGVLPLDHGGTGSATASFSGANITSLNASNISSGILAVARGGTGSSDATFSGANITSLNASNISTGTIANDRTTGSSANGASTLVLRDASGNFSAAAITATSVSGSGASLTSLNASNISSGTIANAYTTASASNGASTIVSRGANGEFAAGAITGTSFTGDGSALTSLNASNISSGTIANARTTASSSNGASTIVARGASGEFSAGTITATLSGTATQVSNSLTLATSGTGLSGSATFNGASAQTFTVASNASSANGASTLVARDASGNFSANTITASLAGNASTASSATSAGSLNGYVQTTAGTANTINLRNSSGYTSGTWYQFTGGEGLYSPSAGLSATPHFYPTPNTYGTYSVLGYKGGYAGISFDACTGPPTLMYDTSGNGGVYDYTNWHFYWLRSNACLGIGTSSTSASYKAYVGGGLYATGNVVAYSDARVKENVTTVSNALDKVLQLRGVTYTRIGDESAKVQMGVIAQEVNKVVPEVVTYASDVDEYGVAYGNFAGLFIEAFKEQQQIIQNLKLEIEELKRAK